VDAAGSFSGLPRGAETPRREAAELPAASTQRGVASAARAVSTPSATKPMRPSPGSENVSPTSGAPATITSDAHALTKPTAAPGASARVAAAPVNAFANGTPAARPTSAAHTTRTPIGNGRARRMQPAPPATRLPAIHTCAFG